MAFVTLYHDGSESRAAVSSFEIGIGKRRKGGGGGGMQKSGRIVVPTSYYSEYGADFGTEILCAHCWMASTRRETMYKVGDGGGPPP